MIEAITTIILFETAYKKDETTFTLYGIEMLVLGITTIFLLDLVSKRNDMINIVIAIMELCFTLYYLVKILVLSLRKNKKSKK